MKQLSRQLLAFVVTLLIATPAWADTLAGLQLKFAPGTDVDVQSDIRNLIEKGVSSNSRFKFQTFTAARAKLKPVVRDCFTNDCLSKAGSATKASFGLRVNFSGEAQIYDWSIDVYDLNRGKIAKSVKGSCELCGRAEVGRTFKATFSDALNGVPKKKTSQTTVVEKPKEDPKKDPDPVVDRDPDPDPVVDTPRVTVTEVRIDVEPPDAIIMMNGTEVGRGSTTLELSPGSYELQFKREGYQGFKEAVVVGQAEATKTKLRVHMSKTDPDPVIMQSGEGMVDRLDNRALWGGISLATGGILLVTGIILSSVDGQPTCAEGTFQECPSVYATGTGGILLTTAGAALATAGAGLLLWKVLSGAPEEVKETTDGATTIAPTIHSGYGGVSVRGSF